MPVLGPACVYPARSLTSTSHVALLSRTRTLPSSRFEPGCEADALSIQYSLVSGNSLPSSQAHTPKQLATDNIRVTFTADVSVRRGGAMSDSKNRSDNERYALGYQEGYTGLSDPLKNTVEGMIFGPDDIWEAGRRNGIAMREREERLARANPPPSPKQSKEPKTKISSSPRNTGGYSQASGGGSSEPIGIFTIIMSLGVIGAVIAYFVWAFNVINVGTTPTASEIFAAAPAMLALAVVMVYFGAVILMLLGIVVVIYLLAMMLGV